MSKTIPQLDPASSLSLTNKIEVSQSDSVSASSVYGTFTQVINNVVNPNAQLSSTSQVTGLDSALASKLNLSGSNSPMTGLFSLSGDPVSNLQPTTKQYVDGLLATKLNLSGGTMTGFLTLNANPITNLEAATKQYVDNSISSYPYVLRAGDTMTGNLVIDADLSIGTSTNFAPLTTQVGGGTSYNTATAAYFGSVVGATGGNFYQISIAKGNYEAIICGINKDSTTGNIPANYAYFSTFSSTGGVAFCQSDDGITGLPSVANILINGSGQVNIRNSLNIGTQTITNNALLQLNSTTKGFMPSVLTSSQEVTLTSSLSSGDAGLSWYNFDTATNNYWDGSTLQQELTLQHLSAGTGIVFDDSVPGRIEISATGGGTPIPGAFASWAIQNNPVTTSVGSSFTPIAVDSAGAAFYNITESDFTNQVLMVSGTYTIVSTYIGSTTQNFIVNANVAIVNGTTTSVLYKGSISVLQSGGTLTATPAQLLGSYPNVSQNLPVSLSGIVELSTGDSVLLQLSNPNTTSNCRGAWINFQIASIAGSITNTDGLPQGSNNKWLTQNGGTTYQYLSGSATVGNLPLFNSTGGQFIDSGILASSVLTSTSIASDAVLFTDSSGAITTDYGFSYFGDGTLASLSLLGSGAGSAVLHMARSTTSGAGYINFLTNTGVGPGEDQWWTGLTNAGSHDFFIRDQFSGLSPFSIQQGTGLITLSSLTASRAVITNGSNQLASLAYGSTNTVSTLVQRDGSGNFSAGTITATLSGNASTATTATNANNVATTSTSSNASFFPLFVASSSNSNQPVDLGTGLTFNPSTNTLTTTTFNGALSGNATTATTATNANNVATTQVSTNASFYPLMASSSTNSNQAADLATGLTYNPSTNILSTTGLSLSGLTQGSIPFVGASGAISQSNSNLFWDNTNNNLYIGANTSTTLDSPGRLVIRGTATSVTNGSDIIFYNTADSHPLFQILPWNHDDVHLGFDCYWNGSNWISSFSSSCFRMYKNGSLFKIDCAGVSQGSSISWTTAFIINTLGDIFTNNLKVNTVGKTLYVKEGSNACKGTVTLSGSSTLVPTTAVATGDMVILSVSAVGGTQGLLSYTISNGSSFTITSTTGILDTSTIKWLIVKAS